MIFPSKYEDPNQTVIAVAATALHRLRLKQTISYSDLFAYCAERHVGIHYTFPTALSLLFLMGQVYYFKTSDSFSIVKGGHDEAR